MKYVKINNYIIRLLFAQAIFLIAINAENNELKINKPLRTGLRSKFTRVHTVSDDNSPSAIKAVIQEKGKPNIKLIWVKTNQLVTSKNLPVWGAQCNDIHESKSEEAEKILDSFVMYQDIKQNSAIIYMKEKGLIFGHVGVDYYIHLPVKHPEKKLIIDVTGPYIIKNINIHGSPQPSNSSSTKTSDSHHNSPSLVSVNKKQQKLEGKGGKALTKRRNFYLETLLFIAYDIVEPIKAQHPDDYILYILLDYAIYFNAIDMMFAKLPTGFRIHINLAGIIIEEDEDAFSALLESEVLENTGDKVKLDGFDKIFMNYFQSNLDFVFEENSFDHVILSTSRGLEYENKSLVGLSFVPMDITEVRRVLNPDELHTPLSIIKKSNLYDSFIDAAHEIAYVLGYQSNSPEPKGISATDKKCSDSQYDSDICFTWDNAIVADIKKYMRKNQNRCWHLNFPLSMQKNNEPKVYELPTRQCKCFGYDSYVKEDGKIKRYIPEDGCGKPLDCVKLPKKRYNHESEVLPFNGTPCSKDQKKVCWKQQCVAITKN